VLSDYPFLGMIIPCISSNSRNCFQATAMHSVIKGIPLHEANLTRGLSTVRTCSIVPTEVHRSHDTLVWSAHLLLTSCATTESKCSKDFAFIVSCNCLLGNFGSNASHRYLSPHILSKDLVFLLQQEMQCIWVSTKFPYKLNL